ncbi:hypothetical protein MRX96_024277 [Rhipicephalus microplus]
MPGPTCSHPPPQHLPPPMPMVMPAPIFLPPPMMPVMPPFPTPLKLVSPPPSKPPPPPRMMSNCSGENQQSAVAYTNMNVCTAVVQQAAMVPDRTRSLRCLQSTRPEQRSLRNPAARL